MAFNSIYADRHSYIIALSHPVGGHKVDLDLSHPMTQTSQVPISFFIYLSGSIRLLVILGTAQNWP